MDIIAESRCHAELRSAAGQCAAFERECIRGRVEFRLETVYHRIEILELNPAVFVTQPSRITFCSRIEARLKGEIAQIRSDRALLIVVVNLTLTQHHVAYPEI